MKALLLTGEKVNVSVVERGASKHHSMRMKSCRRNGAGPVLLQEARVWLDMVKERPVHVENVDVVPLGSPALW